MSPIEVRPANEARWEDVEAVFGTRGDPARCWCQRYKMAPKESWANVGPDALAARLREQADCGGPDRAATCGLVAYLDGEPAGWCAVEPRANLGRLRRDARVPWEGRDEDKADPMVWAVTCFVTCAGYRRRGIGRALAAAAVEHARACGARAVEAYPMTTARALLGELHPGLITTFEAAGFVEIGRPTGRRAVVRIDF
jgi:GNAT superfamily N-acetyltransferase